MKDQYQRNIDYMRISITDRCNLRCRYCMPDGIKWRPMEDILTYEEIKMVCEEAVKLGITHFKITGGEPLVRQDCDKLCTMINEIEGIADVTLTTNGILLKENIDKLIKAKIKTVNVSLDTLKKERFKLITGFDALDKVLSSINLAIKKGIHIRINVVLQKDLNDDEWEDLLNLAKDYPLDVRFIEMMPISFGNECLGISNEWLKKAIEKRYGCLYLENKKIGNGPAKYYQIEHFVGRVGFISAMHGKFCDSCNRIRMLSTGEIKPCLCFDENYSLKDALREKNRDEIKRILSDVIYHKPKAHCFEETKMITEKKQMAQIGG